MEAETSHVVFGRRIIPSDSLANRQDMPCLQGLLGSGVLQVCIPCSFNVVSLGLRSGFLRGADGRPARYP